MLWSRSIRGFLQHAYYFLPRSFRQAVLRRTIQLPENELITVKLAETSEELEAAFRLVYEAYVHDGIMLPSPSGMRITRYHLLPTTSVLVAKDGDEVVGTMSVLQDSVFGVPVDGICDLTTARAGRAKICEISSLAIAPRYRRDGRVLFPLIRFVLRYTAETLRLDGAVCSMHPKHADLYEGLLGFRRLTQQVVEHYAFANNRPAVGLYVPLATLRSSCQRRYAHVGADERNFYRYSYLDATEPRLPARPFLRRFDPIWTPARMRYFLRACPEAFAALTDEERNQLLDVYPEREFQAVLPRPKVVHAWPARPREPRFPVVSEAKFLGLRQGRLRIENVSEHGLRVQLLDSYWMGSENEISVRLNDHTWAELSVEQVWTDGDGNVGLRIREADQHWREFISHLVRVRGAHEVAATNSRGPRLKAA